MFADPHLALIGLIVTAMRTAMACCVADYRGTNSVAAIGAPIQTVLSAHWLAMHTAVRASHAGHLLGQAVAKASFETSSSTPQASTLQLQAATDPQVAGLLVERATHRQPTPRVEGAT